MKKQILTLILAALCGFQAEAARDKGAYRQMPGQSRIEREIQWAWLQLPDFLKACVYSEECGVDTEQKKILWAIAANREHYTFENLIFASEKEQPGLFQSSSGETHRLAMTGQTPDAPVYINRDQMTKLGKSRGIAFWMGILTHEMVHHLGIKDDSQRLPDLIGSSIAKTAEKLLITLPIPEESGDVSVVILNPPPAASSQVLQGFPNGLWFRMLKQDDNTALDEVQPDIIADTVMLCNSKTVLSVRGTPEDSQLANLDAGSALATAFFSMEILCMDKEKFVGFRQIKIIRDAFDLDRTAQGYRVKIWGYSGWSLGADNGARGFGRATILKWQVPKTVNAGSVLKISAEIRAPDSNTYVGCSAFIGSDSWPVTDAGDSIFVIPERCTYKKIGPETYAVEMEKDIPATSATVDLEIKHLCMTTPAESTNCIPAFPAQKTIVKIINTKPAPETTITDFSFSGVREISKLPDTIRFEYPQEKTFFVNFTVKNASSLEQGGFMLGVDMSNGENSGVTLPFTFGAKSVLVSTSFTPSGADLLVRLEFKWGQATDKIDIIAGRFESLYILTNDFHSLRLNLLNQNLSVQKSSAGGAR